jgi:hypothetical protein
VLRGLLYCGSHDAGEAGITTSPTTGAPFPPSTRATNRISHPVRYLQRAVEIVPLFGHLAQHPRTLAHPAPRYAGGGPASRTPHRGGGPE